MHERRTPDKRASFVSVFHIVFPSFSEKVVTGPNSIRSSVACLISRRIREDTDVRSRRQGGRCGRYGEPIFMKVIAVRYRYDKNSRRFFDRPYRPIQKLRIPDRTIYRTTAGHTSFERFEPTVPIYFLFAIRFARPGNEEREPDAAIPPDRAIPLQSREARPASDPEQRNGQSSFRTRSR